jgi:transcriptional regulator with XRE-family HTH domain
MFPERLKQLRNSRNLSQDALAKKIGTAQQTYGHWETGRTEPDHATLIRIADFFGVSIDYLLGREATPTSNMQKTNLSPEDLDLIELVRDIKKLPEDYRKIVDTIIEINKGKNE